MFEVISVGYFSSLALESGPSQKKSPWLDGAVVYGRYRCELRLFGFDTASYNDWCLRGVEPSWPTYSHPIFPLSTLTNRQKDTPLPGYSHYTVLQSLCANLSREPDVSNDLCHGCIAKRVPMRQ